MVIDEGRLAQTAPDQATFDRVRDRLIDQTLLVEQTKAESTRTEAEKTAAASWLGEVRGKFPNPEAFDSALRALDMSESQFRSVLEDHERSLAMIDRRLRPAASPEQDEIAAYYRDTFVPEYEKHGQGARPPLADVEGRIREILVQQKIDRELEVWLKELRVARSVKIYSQ